MKAPYNITDWDFEYCPNCGELTDEFIKTRNGAGCPECTQKCVWCGEYLPPMPGLYPFCCPARSLRKRRLNGVALPDCCQS